MTDDDDIEIDDEPCPHCGNPFTHRRPCGYGCEDGFVNRYEEDPLWYDEDDCSPCPECGGFGGFWWCPKCGHDLRQPISAKPDESMAGKGEELHADQD